MHRHSSGNHLASPWCFPQVWLQAGVLDLCFADSLWVATWYYLCYLGPHQVIQLLYPSLRWICEGHY
ncbi:hypothetical protein HAX54_010937 [Datura stramonium]|uniref:Uncharacterized protein n=1 Tax=Datura stramonium TaxID=4076 RepID=A0ABS8RXK9_DATST|nr:hypothetical protein [Datura stramonium]